MAAHYPDLLWQAELQRGRLAQRLSQALSLLNKALPDRGRLLDIGCATGDFILAAEKTGWTTVGLEVSARQVRAGVERGANVALCQDFLSYPTEATFDAVTFNHVLEHVPSPSAYLRRARQVLKPGGLVLISVPTYDSLSRRLFGPYWTHLDLPRHLFHFSAHTLRLLVERAGFRVLDLTFDCHEENALGVRDSLRRALTYGLARKSLNSRIEGRAQTDHAHGNGAQSAVTFLYRTFGDVGASATEMLRIADTFIMTATTLSELS